MSAGDYLVTVMPINQGDFELRYYPSGGKFQSYHDAAQVKADLEADGFGLQAEFGEIQIYTKRGVVGKLHFAGDADRAPWL